MAEQQMTAFEAFLKRELPDHSIEEIAPGTLNLARNAWAAALSHAEGEAVPAAVLIREIGEDTWFDHRPVPPNSPEHAAAQRAPELDYCVVYTHPAPQVAVPEEFREKLEDLVAAAFYTSDMTSDKCKAGIDELMAMLAAAPTAPAGEQVGMILVPEQSDPNWELRVSKSLNLSHMDEGRKVIHAVLGTAPAGELFAENGEFQPDSEAAMAAIGEQPVSDPDGVPQSVPVALRCRPWSGPPSKEHPND